MTWVMLFQPISTTVDGQPDDAAIAAMKAALRDLKVTVRRGSDHPRRSEMLSILSEARTRIDRING